MTENACEGMVAIQELPGDRYSFDEKTMTIVGQKTGKTFHFGDAVRVKISEVSPKKRTIDLELVSVSE
jgi:ribonuclease R